MSEHIQNGLSALKRGLGRTGRWIRRHRIVLTIIGMIAIFAAAVYGFFTGWWTLGIVYLYIASNATMYFGQPVMTYYIFALYALVWSLITAAITTLVWSMWEHQEPRAKRVVLHTEHIV